jgi:hypothetical protein
VLVWHDMPTPLRSARQHADVAHERLAWGRNQRGEPRGKKRLQQQVGAHRAACVLDEVGDASVLRRAHALHAQGVAHHVAAEALSSFVVARCDRHARVQAPALLLGGPRRFVAHPEARMVFVRLTRPAASWTSTDCVEQAGPRPFRFMRDAVRVDVAELAQGQAQTRARCCRGRLFVVGLVLRIARSFTRHWSGGTRRVSSRPARPMPSSQSVDSSVYATPASGVRLHPSLSISAAM